MVPIVIVIDNQQVELQFYLETQKMLNILTCIFCKLLCGNQHLANYNTCINSKYIKS